MSRAPLAIALAIVGVTAIGSPTTRAASVINFDPDGAGGATTLALGFIDQAPGNALAVNALQNNSIVVGTPFEVLYQAKVGALRGPNNESLAVPGVDTMGELTIIARFMEVAVFGGPSSAVLSLDTPQVGSFVEIYYDPANNADDLTGVGFNDGTLIYRGTVDRAGGGSFAVTSPEIVALDQSPDGDQYDGSPYPNIDTVIGSGGTSLTASTVFTDDAFFVDEISEILLKLNFNTSNVVPFNQINPSRMMFDGTPAATLASIGSVNGRTGPNFLFQSDANTAFTVIPEPTSVLLLSVGLVGAVGYHVRRRRVAA